MRERFVSLVGWLAVMGGLGVLAWGPSQGGDAPLAPTRLLAYELETNEARWFSIDGDMDSVKVLTWITREDDWLEDPRWTRPHCLLAVLETADGSERATWKRWINTRQSVGELEGHPDLAAAWRAEDEVPLSDDRLTLIELPEAIETGSRLRLSSCGHPTDAQVYFVAFASDPRAKATVRRFIRAPDTPEAASAVERFTAREWSELPVSWRERLLTSKWLRLAALDVEGAPATTEIQTTFARASWWLASSRGVPVPPGGAIAYNLEGPTALRLRWRRPDGSPAADTTAVVRTVHADGSVEVMRQGIDSDVLEVGEGVTSIHVGLSADAAEPLMLEAETLRGGIDRVWGDPPRGDIDPEDQSQDLSPDLRNVELYRALPEDAGPPIRFAANDTEHLRLRFVVPVSPALPGLDGPTPVAAPGPVVQIRALDASGREVERWTIELEPQPSLFERYTQLEHPGRAAVGLAGSRSFHLPDGVVAVEVTASSAVDVLARVETALERLVDTPWAGYEAELDETVRGRFVPLVRARWRARAPRGRDVLQRTSRVARMDQQVRLEPAPPSDPADVAVRIATGRRYALPLRDRGRMDLDAAPMALLTEPDLDGQASAGGRARLGTRLGRVEVPENGRLFIEHRVDPARLESGLSIEIGGRVHRFTPRATTGTFTLNGVLPGLQPVRLLLPDGSPGLDRSELLLARTERGSPLWANRKVRRLEPGSTLAHGPLPAGRQVVSVLVYGATGLSRLRWQITGATPPVPAPGRAASPTRGEVLLQPGRIGAWLLSTDAPRLWRSRRVDVVLPEGLPAGGQLELTVVGSGRPVYLRALASWEERSAQPETTQHWAIDVESGEAQ